MPRSENQYTGYDCSGAPNLEDFDFVEIIARIEKLKEEMVGYLEWTSETVTDFLKVALVGDSIVQESQLLPGELDSWFALLKKGIEAEKQKAIARIRYVLGADNPFFMEKARLGGLDDPNSFSGDGVD